jgi:hypothetical protein
METVPSLLWNSLLKVLMLCMIILAPIKAAMIVVGCLIFIDLMTGIWAAIKRQQPVTSAALRRTISKMIIYQIAVISGFLIEHYLVQGELPIVKIVAGFIGIVEFKSILENGNFILGTDIFKTLISKLGSKNDQL